MEPQDVRIETYRGGETQMRLTHLPTGRVVTGSMVHGELRMREQLWRELELAVSRQEGYEAGYQDGANNLHVDYEIALEEAVGDLLPEDFNFYPTHVAELVKKLFDAATT